MKNWNAFVESKAPDLKTIPELKQGRSHGESQRGDFACGFLLDESFARPACHCFNSRTVST